MAHLTQYIVKLTAENRSEHHDLLSAIQAGAFICTDGSAIIRVNNVGRKLNAGDMLLYPPYSKVSLEDNDDDFKGYLASVDYEFVIASVKPLEWSANLHFISRHPVVRLLENDYEVILSLIGLIEHKTAQNTSPLSLLLLSSLWESLTYQVLTAYLAVHPLEPDSDSVKNNIALTFQADLMQHFTTQREVAFYAAQQRLSSRYFSTVIKEVTGHNAFYWIVQAVTGEAKKRIPESGIIIMVIAYSLNFRSPTFFSRWFKQYTGLTPKEFKQQRSVKQTL